MGVKFDTHDRRRFVAGGTGSHELDQFRRKCERILRSAARWPPRDDDADIWTGTLDPERLSLAEHAILLGLRHAQPRIPMDFGYLQPNPSATTHSANIRFRRRLRIEPEVFQCAIAASKQTCGREFTFLLFTSVHVGEMYGNQP